MAWTDEKVRVMRNLWASNWSAAAIGVAIDMTANAVIGKVYRLRRADDVKIHMGDLARSIAAAGNVRQITVIEARALCKEPGYAQGLARTLEAG